MKLKIRCDWCGKEFERLECKIRGKRHLFCSRECLWNFSNKTKNPKEYDSLKDFTNIGKTLSELNRRLNPTRMTPETRKKIRNSRLDSGKGTTYAQYYGRHEHRVVAEKILKRPLKPGEVVHHRDENKRNNAPDNIVIFASQSEHAKHHAELNWFIKELEKMEGGDAE